MKVTCNKKAMKVNKEIMEIKNQQQRNHSKVINSL